MTRKIRVAVIGCGAISQQWHIPILAGHQEFELSALVDASTDILNAVGDGFNVTTRKTDYRELDTSELDAVIIATPVTLHFPISEYFLNHGLHVLVEKPIALNGSESAKLVDIAKSQNLTLSVGLYRRLFPSLSLLKQMIKDEQWGRPLGFSFNWGDFYSWSATSLGNMQKALAGGGVLMDLGPHALDWLTFLFDGEIKLEAYADDSCGGIEADCELELTATVLDQEISGLLSLSRVRKLGGELEIELEKAILTLGVGERFRLEVAPKLTPDVKYQAEFTSEFNQDWYEAFSLEFDDFANAINSNDESALSGQSCLPAMQIIDQCYATENAAYTLPWVNNLAEFSTAELPYKQVLITGATGFIGGRLAEVLSLNSDVKVIAAVNNPNNASRLSRLDLEMRKLDLSNPESIARAVAGCDAIIHCAIGTAYGQDDVIYDITVEGTKRLIEQAKSVSLKRFIHISSLAVMDLDTNDTVTEATPYVDDEDNIYSHTKRLAEQAVKDAAAAGLPAIILRPTNVYGPFSPLFKIGAGYQLLNNGVSMPEATAQAPINAVYIDNLIEVILKGLKCPEELADGRHFLVNDTDDTTYETFYRDFGEAFDKPVEIQKNTNLSGHQTQQAKAGLIKEMKAIFGSKAFKGVLKEIYNSPKLGTPARYLVNKFPAIEDKFRDTTQFVYRRKSNAATPVEIEASTTALVSDQLVRQQLAYQPIVSSSQARKLTQQWLSFTYKNQRAKEL